MRMIWASAFVLALLAPGSSFGQGVSMSSAHAKAANFAGFDRNEYPGDAALPELRKRFAFTGYWLNNPPGASRNPWAGKREALRSHGFGFLVLFNGRVDAELLAQARRKVPADALGRKDAAEAVATAKREGFPAGTIVFLDQEEGGRLLPEQSQYLFAWTETVAASGYRPGVYASGIPANDGTDAKGKPVTITTAQDISAQVASKRYKPVALFVYQDSCPPSNGCAVAPPPLAQSGTPDAAAWQYAQSPRRPELTKACAKTYAADGNCYALPGEIFVDLDVAGSPDPSHGR